MEHNLVLSGDTALSSGRNEGTLTLKDFSTLSSQGTGTLHPP
jgi:hypothetical protein